MSSKLIKIVMIKKMVIIFESRGECFCDVAALHVKSKKSE